MPSSGTPFDLARKEKEKARLERRLAGRDIWEDSDEAQKTIARLKEVSRLVEPALALRRRAEDLEALVELAAEESDEEFEQEAARELARFKNDLDSFETDVFLTGPHDQRNAYLSIQAGAGGTESCDWAQMLLRMYTRYFEQAGYKHRLVELTPNIEAGIKSCILEITGDRVFGRFKGESGIHRLVRISPFDASRRRHTSFVSVDVVPVFDEDIDIEIDENDLHIDTYRASGPGGQHVNKTSSAVRITHIPTGIVVQCQNERSQHQNRATAMRVLKSRLYQLEEKKRQEELAKAVSARTDIAWGHQIRSYVLQPYTLVKDHRTGEQTGNVNAVLDGSISNFLEAYIRKEGAGNQR